MDGDDEEEEEEMEEDSTSGAAAAPGAITVTDCLFCEHHSHSLARNMTHMTKTHSFFLPDIEYLVDLRGFILYLGKPERELKLSFKIYIFEFALISAFLCVFLCRREGWCR